MPMNPPTARFLALGDSYTIGEGVPREGGWPAQLAALLRAAGAAIGAPEIVATTGWTTDELAAAMDDAGLAPPFDLVTLLIGVNNQYRGGGAKAFRDGFDDLLGRAVALAGGAAGRVVVVSIPDWGGTPFAQASGRDSGAIAREIDHFNALARQAALRAGAAFVDVTALSRAADAASLLFADGLLPSAAQYARWAQAILPSARRALDGKA
jgi:lysophospholipase L1-like esterase